MKALDQLVLQVRFHVDEQIAAADQINLVWRCNGEQIALFVTHAGEKCRVRLIVLAMG